MSCNVAEFKKDINQATADMPREEKVKDLSERMEAIYDPDRDYEICLFFLPFDDQEKYAWLRSERAKLFPSR